jgi:hypothetical protein
VPIAAQSGERPIGVSVKTLVRFPDQESSVKTPVRIAFQKLGGPNSKKAGPFEAGRV